MTHYERLGISPGASPEEIKRAFHAGAMKTHPDLRRGNIEDIRQASREFVELSNAYRGLIDPVKRAAYDRSLETGTASPSRRGAAPVHPPNGPRVRMEDYEILDVLRGEIWNEPRNDFIRQTLLYLFFFILLFPLYYVLLVHLVARWHAGQTVWRSFLGTLTIPLVGLWTLWIMTMRVQRIRAAGGLKRFWEKTPHRRQRPRPATSMEWGYLPFVLLALGFVDALLVYVSDELVGGAWRGLVMAVVPLTVFGWIALHSRSRGRKWSSMR